MAIANAADQKRALGERMARAESVRWLGVEATLLGRRTRLGVDSDWCVILASRDVSGREPEVILAPEPSSALGRLDVRAVSTLRAADVLEDEIVSRVDAFLETGAHTRAHFVIGRGKVRQHDVQIGAPYRMLATYRDRHGELVMVAVDPELRVVVCRLAVDERSIQRGVQDATDYLIYDLSAYERLVLGRRDAPATPGAAPRIVRALAGPIPIGPGPRRAIEDEPESGVRERVILR